MPRTARLSRDDWAAAALAALAEGGAGAVAVEPVAARLKASKSSFYWLFENRSALLDAALELWEREQTERVAARLAEIPDPADRLRELLRLALTAGGGDLALRLTGETDAAVLPVAARVTRRRLEFVEAAFRDLGMPAEQAGLRASGAYATYLGTAALARLGAAPTDTDAYIEDLLTAFMPTGPGR
ncbi:TetR family transcriptional regulator [Actinomadura rupiterrae]|uniref:TetR family transcriptional regulator n=1 Tax=Actinomadura rupiterrae TaxID=559627 RepID=UPI0020A33DDD|nr:TetR family transcriptional regulator [Actinomadura rupiterrae]MCP2340269.1 AcrR family transcriptional regulator [Actinomadura rupiterrae]